VSPRAREDIGPGPASVPTKGPRIVVRRGGQAVDLTSWIRSYAEAVLAIHVREGILDTHSEPDAIQEVG
jgi:hypothetical protein